MANASRELINVRKHACNKLNLSTTYKGHIITSDRAYQSFKPTKEGSIKSIIHIAIILKQTEKITLSIIFFILHFKIKGAGLAPAPRPFTIVKPSAPRPIAGSQPYQGIAQNGRV
ncbi:hypothetical protein NEIMUCOT_03761 [Neisseria mucosa ATCC 25996]|uniref:Uncharacterized protein n=1 Tax=Neisseria mucosa (strain ATCC 25996 / DSM 4631 / NCTC 10774 / M26) TaxID=546266 RepID=D2ZT28_NEIM2|nr:hypothetical protein NEIMUCOT_03761 [Neisseria mucosa ATCC 25996]